MSDHTALVVGGTSGIGLATARRLHALGAAVHIVGRSKERLDEVAVTDPALIGHRADGGDRDEITAVAEAIGGIDWLIITLSGSEGVGPIADLDLGMLRRAFDAKFWGAHHHHPGGPATPGAHRFDHAARRDHRPYRHARHRRCRRRQRSRRSPRQAAGRRTGARSGSTAFRPASSTRPGGAACPMTPGRLISPRPPRRYRSGASRPRTTSPRSSCWRRPTPTSPARPRSRRRRTPRDHRLTGSLEVGFRIVAVRAVLPVAPSPES